MPSASDGDEEIMLSGEPNRGPDVRDAGAARHQGGVPVDGSVPYLPVLLVTPVTATDQLTAEHHIEFIDGELVEAHLLGPGRGSHT